MPSPATADRSPPNGTVRRRKPRINVIGSDSDDSDANAGVAAGVGGTAGRTAGAGKKLLQLPRVSDSGSESGDGDASFVNIYEPGSYHKVP